VLGVYCGLDGVEADGFASTEKGGHGDEMRWMWGGRAVSSLTWIGS
jgi:hypothetical protein